MCECELRMKILLIFTLCLISDGGGYKAVTGYSGGGVLIKCEYDIKYTQKNTYSFNDLGPICCYKINANDGWTNQCGADPQSVKVELKATEQDLSISCNGLASLMSDLTVFCMSLQTADRYVKECENVNEGKFSLCYDTKTHTLSVSIRNITERDSGEYWCGAEASGKSVDGKVYFTLFNLTVTAKPTHPSPSSTSPPAEFPASIVIAVSVILLLLLIAFIFLILILQKRCRMKGMVSVGKCCVQCSGNNQENEENKDTRQLCASDVDMFTISPSQIPTAPSDASQTVYDNILLPTKPCVSTIYCTAELPTILPDQAISATAQLPTDHPASSVSAAQQSGGESVTGPVYAAVRSITKVTSSNSTVPKIIIDKEEISCDNESQP